MKKVKKKSILVVGGAGYVGGITTDLLTTAGYDATVFDNLMYEPRYLKECNLITGDVRDLHLLSRIHQRFDEIIWLAAIVGDGACEQQPELTKSVNVDSIRNFLRKTKRRIIYLSTCSVYGAQNHLLNEKSKTNPLSLYAYTKLEAEKFVLRNNGLVFRLGTLFGIGDRYSRIRLDLVVNFLSLRAFRDKHLIVFGGKQWRPLLAVTDVGNYLVEAVNSNRSGVYNLKFENVTIADLAKRFKRVIPHLSVDFTKVQFEDSRNYRVSSRKAERDFSFKPRITVEEEIHRLITLFKEGRIQNVNDNSYYNTNYVKALLLNHAI